MTEIALRQPEQTTAALSIADQMQFAKLAAEGSLLPDAYRNKPANVLIAVGLGQAMGLSPAESLWRIDVIQGKPTASAELIAANVRKAGHKLRVSVTENPPSATATIVRCDDPDAPISITRDMEWAKGMGLVGKDNYKKQPSTMLSWRAISACARLACPEALYGVAYTPDEMADMPSTSAAPSGGLGAALAGQERPVSADAERFVDDNGVKPAEPEPITDRTRKALFALMGEVGITTDDDQRAFLSDTLGRDVASRSTLTEAEGVAAGKRLRAIQQGDPDAEWVPTFDAETGEPVIPGVE